MNGRILAMCASRGRPHMLYDMAESIAKTSKKVDLVVYLDDDDPSEYEGVGLSTMRATRVGPCRAANSLAASNPEYAAYLWAVDDCRFVTKGWDRWVLKQVKGFRGGIGAVSPQTVNGAPKRMDFPCLSGGWVKAWGRFVPYDVEHFYWDIALQLVGESTQIAFASEKEFSVEHVGIIPNPEEPKFKDGKSVTDFGRRIINSHADARTTCRWIALERQNMIDTLNQSIKEAV